MINYNTFHKIYTNINGDKIKLVLNHVDNENPKAYVCRAKEDYHDNFDKIEENKYYVCVFPPSKTVVTSSMNWNKQGYFGLGAIEHDYDYDLNNFEEIDIYNNGTRMTKKQTKFCTVPIESVEIIRECKYVH